MAAIYSVDLTVLAVFRPYTVRPNVVSFVDIVIALAQRIQLPRRIRFPGFLCKVVEDLLRPVYAQTVFCQKQTQVVLGNFAASDTNGLAKFDPFALELKVIVNRRVPVWNRYSYGTRFRRL